MTLHNPLAPAWLEPAPGDSLGAVWPSSAVRDADGQMLIGGAGVNRLAQEYGTPLYVIDEAEARERAERIRAAFEAAFSPLGADVRLYYAAKAFLSIQSALWMTQAGLGIDVCTGGELAVAMAAGIDPAVVGLHGNNKSDLEIDEAVRFGIGTIVLDSLTEIGRVARAAERHGRVQDVRLRVNSGVHAHTHEFLATAHEDQKFGVSLTDAPHAVSLIRSEGSLRFLGLHGHIGSQIFGSRGFAEAAARLLHLHASLLSGGEVPQLNLGGGFGIAYTSADHPVPVEDIAQDIAGAVAAECRALRIPVPAMAFEPGRWIIGPAGITLYRVGTIKDVRVALDATPAEASTGTNGAAASDDGGHTAVRRYLSVDGGMSDNVRPALYGADYTVRLASRRSDAPPVLVRVAGRHCESGDIVVPDDYLPSDVVPGDLVALAATGAYCWSLSSNYNYVGTPPVVAVRDGASRMLIRGQGPADLLARNIQAGTVVFDEPRPSDAGRDDS